MMRTVIVVFALFTLESLIQTQNQDTEYVALNDLNNGILNLPENWLDFEKGDHVEVLSKGRDYYAKSQRTQKTGYIPPFMVSKTGEKNDATESKDLARPILR